MIYKALILFNLLKQDVLNQEIINIKDVKLPNFFKTSDIKFQWEFCHQFTELYESYILSPIGKLSYENENVQINKGDIVFDCGANMGLFAAYAATKGAQVYCFEPCSSTRELLKQTQSLYPEGQITIIPKALSNTNNIETFFKTDNIGANRLWNSLMRDDAHIIEQEQVETIRLDTFIEETGIIPDFIKIDIEGSENNLLSGFNSIKKYNPKIAIATYHTKNDKLSFKNYFNSLNYNVEESNEIMFLYKGDNNEIFQN